jgi:prophage tail gpP-like protein
MTQSREDLAELEIGGVTLDAWTSYTAESDLFTAADAFRLSIGVGTSSSRDFKRNIARLRELCKPGGEGKLWITSGGKRALQGVFVIDRAEVSNDSDGGTQFGVQGRDRAAYLVDDAADPKLYAAGDTLVSVARKTCAPWGIEVTADHVAARDLRQARVTKDKLRRLQNKARSVGLPPRMMSEKLAASIDKGTIDFDEFVAAADADLSLQRSGRLGIPNSGGLPGLSSLKIYQIRVSDTRPQSGESRWEFLDRHAKRNGLLMSMSPDGKLVFCGLHYSQPPSYHLIRRIDGDRSANNIISGSAAVDLSQVYSDVTVYGRAKGKDKSRSAFKGTAKTSATDAVHVPFKKSLEVTDNSIRSKADAQRRAEYELGRSRQSALAAEFTVQGHSQSGLIWAPDTVVSIEDDVTGIYGNWYITARTFAKGGGKLTTTQLKAVPLGAIALANQGDGD